MDPQPLSLMNGFFKVVCPHPPSSWEASAAHHHSDGLPQRASPGHSAIRFKSVPTGRSLSGKARPCCNWRREKLLPLEVERALEAPAPTPHTSRQAHSVGLEEALGGLEQECPVDPDRLRGPRSARLSAFSAVRRLASTLPAIDLVALGVV